MHERDILLAALEKQRPGEREAFLAQACGDDAALRSRVNALLLASEVQDSFLEHPALETEVLNCETDALHQKAGEHDALQLDFLRATDNSSELGLLGQYAINEVIGRGGMGVVLKGRDAKLNRVVAIKVMAPELASNPTARKRFLREAQAAAAVVHQHIVTIHAVDEDRLPYLVMEFVDGQSLQEKIDREGHLRLVEILRIGQQVAAGLTAAHAHGLMHRDVKPANILLENGVERVRITDFGLARAVDDVGMTRTGEVAGTPQYMSPEQAQGQPMDARSDLFSLGCVLYAMCTGRSPFRAESAFATARRVCEDTPRPIREVNPEIPNWLVAIIDRLLAKSPADRFQSAAEVASLLGQHLAHIQDPTSAPLPVIVTAKQKPRAPAKLRVLRLPRRRLALAVVALLGVAISLGLAEATGVTHLGATVIRIFTPSGTLVVEAADPALKVTVEGDGGLTITGAGLEEIRLRPGSYKVHADKDGQRVPLERELVSIAKNGREVVKVKLETGDRRLKPTTGAFTPLFNGKDLTGWTSMQGSVDAWRVEDGALTCSGPTNYLRSIRDDFGDFHLRAVVKINAGGNSGIYFRTGNQLVEVGDYEAQITNKSGQQEKTGSLYNLARVGESPVPPNTWFTLEIIAVGKQIRVLVNGTETANYTETRAGRKTKGHIALQHLDSETSVFFRKIEIKQLPPAKSTAEGTFVLLGGKGIAERKFDTLDDAVLGASDGDTIEIRGNGPFVSQGVSLRHALVIRAGEGFVPSIRLSEASATRNIHLISSSAPLVLEGLVLRVKGQAAGPVEGRWPILLSAFGGAKLHVANCRLSSDYLPITSGASEFSMLNCEVLSSNRAGVDWYPPPGGRCSLENSVISVGGLALNLRNPDLKDLAIRLRNNTICGYGLSLWRRPDLHANSDSPPVVRWDFSRNVVCCPPVADRYGTLLFDEGLEQPLAPADAEAFIRRLLELREERNVYGRDSYLLKLLTEKTARQGARGQDLVDWDKFWGQQNTGSVVGDIRFDGGDLIARAKAAQEQLTAANFRLRADSAGYRAGPEGKDLGADVHIVGPGAAYERWKKTPEYQEWLKETGQFRAAGPEPETKAFVLLGVAGVAERKFETLADAVQRASDGDTIEIRGNGPFFSETINCQKTSLTIRAADGFRPVIKLRPESLAQKVPLLETSAALVLEGLELHRAPVKDNYMAVQSREAPLRAVNCRFRAPVWSGRSPVRVFRNCEFLADHALENWQFDSHAATRVSFENCVFCTKRGAISSWFDEAGPRDVSIQVKRSTFVTAQCFLFALSSPSLAGEAAAPIRVEGSESIFEVPSVVGFEQTRAFLDQAALLEPAEAEGTLSRLIQWRGERNLFGAGGTSIRWIAAQKLEPPHGPKGMDEWKRFWGAAEVGSLEGLVRFQGGRLLERTDLDQLTPADFRLRPDSPGYRAGPDGKDLGADVDLVGPGSAYERWKKTPEYQEWLKDTGQLKVTVAQPEPLKLVRRFSNNNAPWIKCIQFSPESDRTVVTSFPNGIDLSDRETGALLKRIPLSHEPRPFGFSADGTKLVGVTYQGKLFGLQWPSGEVVFENPAHQLAATAGVMLSGSRFASTGHDGLVRIWNAQTGEKLQELPPSNPGQNYSLAVAPDEQHLVAGGQSQVSVWNLSDGKFIRAVGTYRCNVLAVAISPDNRYVLTGGSTGLVQLFELDTGILVRQFDKHKGAVGSLEFLPDGRHFLSGAVDGTLSVWSFDGQEVACHESSKNDVSRLAVTSDGRQVLTAGTQAGGGPQILPTDATLQLWELPPSVWPVASEAKEEK